jgi:rSAM/selenodomain-associated transferase 1
MTLGVFAKWPQPGEVKTRLAATTSPQWAASLAQACLLDTLDRLARVPKRRFVIFTPATAQSSFASVVAGRFELRPQSSGDLGQRMKTFFADCLQDGTDRAVLVGTDSPNLPTDYVVTALADLERVDVVLGPATDGGYYLIGCARRLPPIFDGIAWSTSRVLDETVTLLREAGMSLALLPPWYDVDTLSDCRMLRGHLAALRAAGVDPEVPHVEAVLNRPSW